MCKEALDCVQRRRLVPGPAEGKQSWAFSTQWLQWNSLRFLTLIKPEEKGKSLCLWIIKIFQFRLIHMSHILTLIFLQQSPVPNLCPQRKTCCVWMIPLSWRAAFTPCTFICARKETHISPYYKHQAHRDQRLLGRTEIQMTFGVIWISEFLRLLTEKTVTEINSLTSWSFKASHLMASREVCSRNTYWINQ